jgi:valyl-tRNA synthetase
METGYDIIFFWVARMIVMGLENMGEAPFHTVYLHGLVRDPEGIKMSKTRGNVMDPLDLIDIYGADALRLALTTGNSPGNDMRLNEQKMEAGRNFANKLWNSARFVMTNLEDAEGLEGWHTPPQPTHRHDRWILSRLSRVAAEVDRYMEDYQFGEAQRVLHDFWWNEYCDWYIEMSKIRMRGAGDSDSSPLPTLAYVLERTLRLLHPFMPFITEEIWQTLMDVLPVEPNRPESLIVAPYPQAESRFHDDDAEAEVGALIEMVRAIRNLRAEFRIQNNQRLEAVVDAPDIRGVVEAETSLVTTLARVDPLRIESNGGVAASNDNVAVVLTKGTVTIPLGGLVDLEKEKARLSDELAESNTHIMRLEKRLSDEQFTSKAPEEVVEKERQRLEDLQGRKERISEILSRLGG